jgi:hypothetical protein
MPHGCFLHKSDARSGALAEESAQESGYQRIAYDVQIAVTIVSAVPAAVPLECFNWQAFDVPPAPAGSEQVMTAVLLTQSILVGNAPPASSALNALQVVVPDVTINSGVPIADFA